MNRESKIVDLLREDEKRGLLKGSFSVSRGESENLEAPVEEMSGDISNEPVDIGEERMFAGDKKLETNFQISEEKYRLIAENTSDLIAITTFSLKPAYTYVSPSYTKILGYHPEEMIGKNGFDFIHPDDRRKLIPLLKNYLVMKAKKLLIGKEQEIVERVDFRIKDKSGNWHYMENTVNIIGNELLFISKDITDQKEVQLELNKQHIFEQLRTAIWKEAFAIDDEKKIIQMLFREFSKTIKYDHGSYIALNHEEKKAICEISWDKTRGDKFGVGEKLPYWLFKHAFGKEIITFSINNVPNYAKPIVIPLLKRFESKSTIMIAYGDIQKPYGYLTLEDYSDANRNWSEYEKNILKEAINIVSSKAQRIKTRKELEHAHQLLREINVELEAKVQERTDEIKRLLTQKDEFINQLGHDLKNPLSPLINLLPILEKKEDDPKKKEIIEVMTLNAYYMKDLVKKTLELARLNSPNTKLNIESFLLKDEIYHIIENNKLALNEKHISVVNNVTDSLMVNADKLRFDEVITNLLSNSAKYSINDSIITINAKEKSEEILVSIQDTGIGMTKEQLERLFDEFYKADSSRHDFDSSGLGMSIAKRIVEKHGGRIWAESEGIGKGSIFYFTLPKNHVDIREEKAKTTNNDGNIHNKLDMLLK